MKPRAFAALAIAIFAVIATANSGGYRFGASDQAFYVPALELQQHPDLFPRDRALLEPQMKLWLGGRLLAGLTAAVGGDLAAVFAVFYVVTLVALALAGLALARSVRADGWTTTAFLALLTLRHRIAKTGANSLEGYAHPRMLAFAIGLGALAFLVRGRTWVAALLVALAGVIHTTTGAWFALLLVCAVAWNMRAKVPQVVAVAVTVIVAVAGVALLASGRLGTMDATWLGVLEGKDYLFPAEWPAYAWLMNLAYPVVLLAIFRTRQRRRLASAGEAAMVAGLLALLAIFLISVPLAQARIAFIVQLQVNRVFWLFDAVVALYVAWWAVDMARTAQARRLVAVAIVSIAVARGVYVLHFEARRPLFQVRPPLGGWMDAMAWLKAQPASWHVLADPGHAWKYGLSVRVAALRDTVIESGKDSAMAMYDRSVAARVAERTAALNGFEDMTTDDIRKIDAAYSVDVLVERADRRLDFPVIYRNADFTIYDLR